MSAKALLALTPGRVIVSVPNAIGPESAPQHGARISWANDLQGGVVHPSVQITIPVLPHLVKYFYINGTPEREVSLYN